MYRALMIQGTSSHAGKSVLTAAFARWLHDQGRRVAPFKAQNMSLNSYVTLKGEEIARSQAVQAEALGLEPTADMNPILLKPMEHGSQVIVQGRSAGLMSIHEYHAYKPQAWRAIAESYDRLAAGHDLIVLEGAGSPAEINLREHDLVNMRMAEYADALVVLVADIERGGVFAQLVGTWELLEPAERERVQGFIINKFRGDVTLLQPGLDFLQRRTGRPVLGVLPFDPNVQLDEEDSLGTVLSTVEAAEIDVAVIRLPGLSNFTDLAALSRSPGVGIRWIGTRDRLHHPDLVILPGTRTTVRALDWLRGTGLANELTRLAVDPDGPYLLGICGGCQILGRSIRDPDRVESSVSETPGLGLLDLDTRFTPAKSLYRVEGEVIAAGSPGHGCPVIGYEVHQGISERRPATVPWLRLRRHTGEMIEDGAVAAQGRVYGTYVHGLFDDARFCRSLIAFLRQRKGLPPLTGAEWLSQRDFWATRYRNLGSWLARHIDLRPVESGIV